MTFTARIIAAFGRHLVVRDAQGVERSARPFGRRLQVVCGDQVCCEIDPHHGPKFDTIQLTFTAAAEGMGVAMGRLPLVEDYLRSGVLIEPFAPLRVASQNAYWLLSPAASPLSEGAAKLRAWLRAELGLTQD